MDMREISYDLVSMAAILRDYIEPVYLDKEHEKLTDIADSLYAGVVRSPEEFLPEYYELYQYYGKEYFDLVLRDMSAIDSQITSDLKRDELIADYGDRLASE